jgi:hypothetical protein
LRRRARARNRRLIFEAFEDRTLLAVLVNTGTAADVIYTLPATASTVFLEDDGVSGNGMLQLRTFSGTFTTTVFANPTGSLTINRGNASDKITINALPDFTASLTIGSAANPLSTITLAGAMTLASNKSFVANASGTIATSGTTAKAAISGTGIISLTTARDIRFVTGSSITTVNGSLTLSANQQASPTSGNFAGIFASGAVIQATGSGVVTLLGRGGDDSSTSQQGVELFGSSTVSGGSGGLQITGQGGGTGTSSLNVGVTVDGSVVTAVGTGVVTVQGTGGAGTGTSNHGVWVLNTGASITSGGGNVSITGQAGGTGTSGFNQGVQVYNSAQISAGGTGTVTVQGTGGAGSGDQNDGIIVSLGAKITSGGGNVQLTGQAGGSSSSAFNAGLYVSASTITAGGTGKVTVQGTGGPTSGGSNFGIWLSGSTSLITSGGGAVQVTGLGGGSGSSGNNYGVYLFSGGQISAGGTGTVTVQGTGGQSGSGGIGVFLFGSGNTSTITSGGGNISVIGTEGVGPSSVGIYTDSALITTAVNGGSLTLVANSMALAIPTASTNASGSITIKPLTSGVGINLGSGPNLVGGPLNLLNLLWFTAGTINIGDANSGPITINSYVYRTVPTAINLTSGGAINFSGGPLDTGGGNLVLSPGSPASVGVAKAGNDVSLGTFGTTGTLSFASGSDLAIALNGTTVDTQYNQLNVIGMVDLTGVDLVLSGTYQPAIGDSLRVVNNDGTDAITGTFNGLADGATFTTTVGGATTTFQISYHGGDGNDVVLVVLIGALQGTAGDDTWLLQRNADNVDVTFNGAHYTSLPFASLSTLTVNGLAGNDTLNVDLSAGNVIPPGGLFFNGGNPTTGPGDKLNILGGSQGTVTYSYTNGHDGSVSMSNFGTVNYTGLEPISNTGSATSVVFNLPTTANTAVLEDDGTSGNGISQLRSTNGTFETTAFADSSGTVAINRGNSADVLSVSSLPDLTSGLNIGSFTSPLGSVSLNGTLALAPGKSFTIYAGAQTITATGSMTTSGGGNIQLTADTLDLNPAGTLNAGLGMVTLSPESSGRVVTLGAETTGTLSLTDAELDQIVAGTLRLGDSVFGGAITIAAPINVANNTTPIPTLHLVSHGAVINNSSTSPAVTATNLAVEGFGGSGSATTLTTQSSNLAASYVGSYDLKISNSGDLTITNVDGLTGGTGSTGGGMSLTTTGSLTINAPIGSDPGPTVIAAAGQDKLLTVNSIVSGIGDATLTADKMAISTFVNFGGYKVTLQPSTANTAINLGSATDAAAGTLELSNTEIGWVRAKTLQIGNASSGSITAAADITPLAGTNINLTSGAAINFTGGTLNSSGGAIALAADSVEIGATAALNAASGAVTIGPLSPNVPISLGVETAGQLSLTDAELDRVTAGTINVGNATSGAITIATDITRAAATAMNLASGASINFTTGTINTNGGNLVLAPGGTGSVGVVNVNTDVTVGAGTLSFGGNRNLLIPIFGTTEGQPGGFDSLKLSGNVNLAGANLVLALSGSFTPAAGTTFQILNNLVGSNTTSGTFTGFAEGRVLSATIGGTTVDFQITYKGGDGNDVVLTTLDTANPSLSGTSANDTWLVKRNGNNVDVTLNGTVIWSPLFSPLNSLAINGPSGSDGNDTLTVDLSAGDAVPPAGINYNGGLPTTGPGDKLIVTGGSQGDVTYNYTNAHDGSVVMSNFGTVNYTGLEPISNTGAQANITFNLPVGPSTAFLEDEGTTGNGIAQLRSTNGTFETTVFSNPSGSVTIVRGSQSDTLTVNDLPATDFNAGLTIGAAGSEFSTVTFAGGITLAANKSIAVDATGTISLPNATSDVAVSGTGSVTLTTARNISFSNGSSIAAANGAISLSANQQATPTSGNFVGVDVNGAAIQASGTGGVTVQGTGGNDSSSGGFQYGVRVRSSGLIKGGISGLQVTGTGRGSGTSVQNEGVRVESLGQLSAAGLGAVNVQGTGGVGSSGSNHGVAVTDSGSSITSDGGAVHVIGQGGVGAVGGFNYGVYVRSSGIISSGGTASVLIEGTGGVSPSNDNVGVYVAGGTITSSGGNVQVLGQGQGSVTSANSGVVLNGGTITAGGGGSVAVTGTAGNTSGDLNIGVWVDGGTINSSGGNVTVVGQGGGSGSSASNAGVRVQSGQISAGGAGAVLVKGTGGAGPGDSNDGVFVGFANATITSSGGDVDVIGIEGSGSSGIAIFTRTSGSITTAANGGMLTLSGNSMSFDSTSTISAGATASVTLRPFTIGVGINLGLASDPIGGPLGLTDGELDRVTAGTINIGNANSGSITISDVIDRGAGSTTAINLTAGTNNSIAFTGSGSLDAKNGNVTLLTNASGSGAITSGTAAVDVSGANVSLTAGSGGIGASGNPLVVSAANLNSTTGGNGNQFLSASGSTTIDATSLSAGTGTIELDGGTFTLGGSQQINDATKLNVHGATFAIGANNETIGGLTLTGGSVTGTTGVLTSTTTYQTQSGSISAILAATNGLTQSSNGVTTLSGANLYTGATAVNGGHLVVTGSIPGSVSVASGAALDGTGTTGAVSIANGGNLSPGLCCPLAPPPSPGILKSGNLTLSSGSQFNVELGGPFVGTTFDQQNVAGTVSLGGATLNLGLFFTPGAGNPFTIINNDGADAVSGIFSGLPEGTVFTQTNGSFTGTFEITYRGGDGNDVGLTAVDPVNPILTGTSDDDVWFVKRNLTKLDITLNGALVASPVYSSLTSLSINSLAGDDTLTIDSSAGDPIPAGGIDFDGGASTATGDNLILVGSSLSTVTYNYTNSQAGGVTCSFGTVNYQGLEQLSNKISVTNAVVNLPTGPNTLMFGDDGTIGNALSRLNAETIPSTDFVSPTGSLTINRGNPADTLTVNALPDFNARLAIGAFGSEFNVITFAGAVTMAPTKTLIAFAGTITTIASLTTQDADIAFSATGDIMLNDSLASGGGTVSLTADSDGNGSGTLRVSPTPGAAVVAGSGNVTVLAADVDIQGAISSTGIISFASSQSGRPITFGSKVIGSLGLSLTELDWLTAGVLQIGNALSGSISVTTTVNLSRNVVPIATLQLRTGGAIEDGNASGRDLTVTNLDMSATAGIGTAADPLEIATDVLTTDSSMGSGGQFLSEADTVTVGVNGLNAASGTIELNAAAIATIGPVITRGGAVSLSAAGDITLNNALASSGGEILLNADSDSNGTGKLAIAPTAFDSWTQQQKVAASDDIGGIGFGFSVALSADGNVAVVGADLDKIGGNKFQGSCYVFARTDNVWTEQQKLTVPDGATFDEFGSAVAISSDGTTIIVTATNDQVGGNAHQGSAYVYTRSENVWILQQQLTATGAQDFGQSVALSSDGNTAIIGTFDVNGSAYVFARADGSWSLQQQLSTPETGDFFGIGVALSGNGDTAIVGAMLDNVGDNARQGSAYVFTRSAGIWTIQQKLVATGGNAEDDFGRFIAMSSDGNTAIVSASHDDSVGRPPGSAYVFVRNGNTWGQAAHLLPSDSQVGDKFGSNITISADGSIAIVGALFDDVDRNVDQGAAFVFTRSGEIWSEQKRLTEVPGQPGDHFGFFSALSADGQTAIIGTDFSASRGPGTAYAFARSSGGSVDGGDGKITIQAAGTDIQGPVLSRNTVSFTSSQAGQPIDLGTNANGSFGLTDGELDLVSTPDLQVGSSSSGPITISADIARSASTLVRLTSGGAINFTGGSINTGGGDLLLSPGTSVSVGLTKSLNDLTLGATGTLSFATGSQLAIAINGTEVDTEYDQLNVVGRVDLTGVDLLLSGTYRASIGDSFVLVHNDGTDAVIGTFNGLEEGKVFVAGDGTNTAGYKITYQGGDGNDVVLTAINTQPNFTKGPDEAATDENAATHGLALPIVVPGWATSIIPGLGADEADQQLLFKVTTDNDALFAARPAINAVTGDLTFTPAPNVDGTAHISVVLMDNGGTANGGSDASAAQTFDIVITKPHIWHNTKNGLDVNDDGHVAANDVVAIVNYINGFGSVNGGRVPALGAPLPNGLGVAGIGKPFGYIDVNPDDFVTAADALAIINVINANQVGGEGDLASANNDLMTLLAVDVALQAKRRQ